MSGDESDRAETVGGDPGEPHGESTPKRGGWLLGLGLLLVLVGGVRLTLSELRLARQTVELGQLREGSAAQGDSELDLKQVRARAAMLAAELKQARRRVGEANQLAVEAEAELRRARSSTQSSSGELKAAEDKAAAAAARATAARRERDTLGKRLAETEELAAREARRALAAEREAAKRKAEAEAAERRVVAAKRAVAAAEAALTRVRGELTTAEGHLAKARVRAAAAEGTVKSLRAAGVNVDRLSGKRPMPAIQAIVVQVDTAASPTVVLVNAGKVNGLEPKDILYVVRGGREVARLEVDEVNAYLSTTRVVRSVRAVTLRPSDPVRSRPPKSP